MTLPNTLWFPSDSTCTLSQRVSGLFQHRKKYISTKKKKKKDNKNPWWDSNFTFACLKVWEEAAKRHSRRRNSQQANVQIKKWEIRSTNVQRIGWNRLWNWVLNREKGPKNAPKHWRAAASGTAITRSPVWDGTEEITKVIAEVNGTSKLSLSENMNPLGCRGGLIVAKHFHIFYVLQAWGCKCWWT